MGGNVGNSTVFMRFGFGISSANYLENPPIGTATRTLTCIL